MLYKYPFLRLEANRLHVYVCQLFRNLRSTNKTAFDLDLCPPELRVFADRSGVLRGHLTTFGDAYFNLPNDTDRERVFEVFVNNNAIEAIMEGARPRLNCCATDIHEDIREPTKGLFKFMFEDTLKLDGKLKIHYKSFYALVEKTYKKACPFCGLETLISPVKGMQDYDHLLYKDLYPMSAVNMRNLVPMCIDCNRRYKRVTDILLDEDGNQRTFFFPFNDIPKITVDLSNSPIPNDTDTGENWIIEFKPDIPEVVTWATVFDLRERYKLDVFKVGFFNDWLTKFIKHSVKYGKALLWNGNAVRDEMINYLEDVDDEDYRTLGFIKHSVFEFLLIKAPDDYFEDLALEIAS